MKRYKPTNLGLVEFLLKAKSMGLTYSQLQIQETWDMIRRADNERKRVSEVSSKNNEQRP